MDEVGSEIFLQLLNKWTYSFIFMVFLCFVINAYFRFYLFIEPFFLLVFFSFEVKCQWLIFLKQLYSS